MAKKKPQAEYLSQNQGINLDAIDAFIASRESALQQAPAELEDRGIVRGIGDVALSAGRGAVQGVRMLTDLAGSDNAASRGLRSVEDFIGGLRSAQAQRDEQQIAEILKAAEGAGVLDQVIAGAKAFAVAPVSTLAQAVGTSLPTIGAALIPGVGQGAAAARMASALGVGAAQGAGSVKGQIYDTVKQELLQAGASPEEADQRALQASSYEQAGGKIATGAALGAAAGSTGMERAVGALARGVTREAPGIARRVVGGGLIEAVPEFAQGAQEKVAGNQALYEQGFNTAPMDGVIAAGTMEGLAGFGMGAAAGIPRPAVRAGDTLRKEGLQPERGPATRALNAAVESAANKVDFDPSLLGAADRLKAAAGLDTLENAGTTPGAAPPKQTFGNEIDFEKTFDTGGLAVGDAEQIAAQNIARIASRHEPMPRDVADGIVAEATKRGQDMVAVNHPEGGGFTVVPRAWVTSRMAQAANAIGPMQPSPGERAMQAAEGLTLEGDPTAEQAAIAQRRAQIEAAPVERAPRVRTDAADLSLDPVAAYVRERANDGTMAGRAFAQDFAAGRITPDDVRQIMARRPETADERIAAAAAQAKPAATPQPGDILNPSGEPFRNNHAAVKVAKRDGGSVIAVEGGWVVRPKESDAPATAGTDGLAATDAGRSAGTGGVRDGGPGDVQGRPAVDAGQGDAGPDAASVRPGSGEPATELSNDLPTLRRQWQEAAQAGDTERAKLINDRIVSVKANAAVQPATAQAEPVQAPAPAPVAATPKSKPARARAAKVAADGVKPAGVESDSTPKPEVVNDQAARWDAMTAADRLPVLKRAGWTEGSKSTQAMQAKAWDKLSETQRKKVADAMGETAQDQGAAVAPTGPVTERDEKAKAPIHKLKDGMARSEAERPQAQRETVTPAEDTPVGKNAAGESLYERKDGSRYRLRDHNGKPNFGGDLSPVEQPSTATHTEPGAAPEPATAVVVSESIKKAAPKVDRKPSEMKADLLAQIDAAMANASDEYLPTWTAPTKAQIRNAMVSSGLTNEARIVQMLEQNHQNRVAEIADRIGHVMFDVPGDGKFKVLNTRSKLEEFRKRVSASPGFKTTGTAKPEGSSGGEKGYGSGKSAIEGMIDEGDPQAAVDYAAAKGLDLAEVLKGDKVRLSKVAGLKATEATDEAKAEQPAPDTRDNINATTDRERALRDKAHDTEKAGDVMLGNGRFVSFDDAVTAARKAVADGALDPTKPFQFNRVLDIAPASWDRMVQALAESETSPTPQGERNGDQAQAQAQEVLKDGGGEKAAAAKIEDVGEKIGGARKDVAVSTGTKGKKSEDDGRPAWARRFKIAQIVRAGGQINAPRDEGRWVISDSRSTDWMGQPKRVGRDTFATKEEAEAFVPIAAVSLKHKPVPTRGGKYEIWREITDRKRVKVVDREFDTRDEAMLYMAANAQQIIETNTTFGEADMPLPPDRSRRGQQRRSGDVTGNDFKETFGFRGVEFGNWNNQDERQALMNDAWDGLMDLADVLGLPPKAIGLNGDLALAFGARGHGLQSARAHYELDRAVINLTKEKGAGSLAHEWFHALDHYFGRQDGKASATWKINADGTRELNTIGDGADMVSSGFTRNISKVRPEVRAAYEALLQTMTRKAEAYVEDVAKVDKFTGTAKEELAKALDSLRRDLSEQKDPTYWKRNNKPASAELLAEFDVIAKAMVDGDVASISTDWRTIESANKAKAVSRYTNDALERLSAIYKEVRGRAGFDATNKQGVMDRLRGYMERYNQRLKMLADAQASTEKQRMVPTEFAMNARELDQGRGGDYWTTPHEMAARAFQGYVEDKIAEQGNVSRFLNYGPENAGILTPWGFKRPFPTGSERKAINAAFDKLVGTLQTRQDDAGNVAVFSRADTTATRGVNLGSAQALADQLASSGLLRLNVVQSTADLPARLQRQLSKSAPDGRVRGVYFKSTDEVWMVADHIRGADEFVQVALHEAFHRGLGKLIPDAKPLLREIWRTNQNVRRITADQMRQHGIGRDEAIEEALAKIAEAGEVRDLKGWPKLLEAIRTWLGKMARAVGIEMTWTDDMVADLVAASTREGLRAGVHADTAVEAMAASRGDVEQSTAPAVAVQRDESGTPTEIAGSRVVLAYPQPTERIEVIPGPGQQVLSYAIMPSEGFDVLGFVELLIEDGKPVSLLDIEVNKEGRKAGVGSAVIETLLAAEPDSDLNISNIVESARGFWSRMGVPEQNRAPGEAYDGTLNWNTFAQAQAENARATYRMGGEVAGPTGSQPDGRGQGANRRSPFDAAREGEGEEVALSRVEDMRSAMTVLGIQQRAHDLMATKRSFNWWHRTVGTQYHKAQIDADFGRVYNATQDYLHDTSAFANDPADLAPDLLPQLKNLGDLKKTLGLNKPDRQKLGAAVFQGTLEWTRDDSGQPVKAGPEDTAGIVWAPDELRSMFGFNDRQVKLYEQFRASVDRSLDTLVAADVARLLGDDLPPTLKALVSAGDLGRFKGLVMSMMQDNPAIDAETRQMVQDKYDRIDQLKEQGYAPLMRFGRYTVDVVNADGERQFFGLYESEAEANRAARAFKESADPGDEVTQGVLSEEAYKQFQGMTPETLELFAEVAGVEKNEVFQEYLRRAKNNRSALKRLIQRQGIKGYSEDTSRVLAQFIVSNARAASSNLHMGEMADAVQAIPKQKGDVIDEAIRLKEYVQTPQEEAQALRGLLFATYLGGSVASAMVNLTQPLMMTFPYLSQFGGPVAAASRLTGAIKAALGSYDRNSDLGKALAMAEKEGIVSPQELHQLQAEASSSLSRYPALRRLSFAWGSLFSAAEQFNRRVSFIAAFNTAQAIGKADPFAFASKAVEETQGTYNKGNKPRWARGTVGATLFTFKQYSVSYMEFLKRLPTRERTLALAILLLAAGAQGMPGADDLDDLIDTLGQGLGYDTNAKLWKTRVLSEAIGADGADFVLRGFSALPGFPLDVAGRLGLGNMIPGTGLLMKSKQDKGSEVAEALGPAASLAKGVTQAVPALAGGNIGGVMEGIAPKGIKDLRKALEMYQTGEYRDTKGRKVAEADTTDALVKGLGFQPASIAADSRKVQMVNQQIALTKATEAEFADQMARARVDGDPEAERKARQRLADWNARNPESRIVVTPAQIARRARELRTTRDDRFIRTAPREMRQAVRETLT